MKLTLVSPHIKGKIVKQLQTALKSKGYLQGSVDSEYGPDTARAVYRAKYWLGYRKPDQVAGDLLYSLLLGTKKPNLAMRLRITNRSRVAKKKPLRLKMWEEAAKYIGETEHPPNSNRSKFSLWYGIIGPWCAMFVTFLAVAFGSKTFKRSKRYAYVPYILHDAKAGVNNLAICYKPLTGMLALYDWDNDGVPDHIGLFGEWLDKAHTRFKGREGNTGPHNFSNGGMVMDTIRYKSDVVAFVNVGR